ncbi:MAG: 5-deoxy-glucuronate isomerase [Acidimicrobiales bacterium]
MADEGGRLHFPAGTIASDGDPVQLTPHQAGWEYCGLRVIELCPNTRRDFATGEDEAVLLPLAGSFDVSGHQFAYHLIGRRDVFSGVTDFAYLPPRREYQVEAPEGGRLAIASARATHGFDPAYGSAASVPVEIRGSGSATRQVNNFMAPESFRGERLMAVEVLTPSGNWSSYPPHKHDEERPGETKLEEIYYFEFQVAAQQGEVAPVGTSSAFGLQHLYSDDGLSFTGVVGNGDVVLVPRGYHGPSAAAPGYDMYYLNVLAGPGPERSMAFFDDPAHSWVRSSWAGQQTDVRLPMCKVVTAEPRRPLG